jgi:hypothetical protein
MRALVDDSDGLSSEMDGSVGTLFIKLFMAMELDFQSKVIHFYKSVESIPDRHERNEKNGIVIVDTALQIVGAYEIDKAPVFIAGRGPSKTILSWKGVADLGLSQSSKLIVQKPISAKGTRRLINASIVCHR